MCVEVVSKQIVAKMQLRTTDNAQKNAHKSRPTIDYWWKTLETYIRNRAIHGGVIVVSVFDLMTLNMLHMMGCCGIIFTKFKLSQPIRDLDLFWPLYLELSHSTLDVM